MTRTNIALGGKGGEFLNQIRQTVPTFFSRIVEQVNITHIHTEICSLVHEAFSYGIQNILFWFNEIWPYLHCITMEYAISRMKIAQMWDCGRFHSDIKRPNCCLSLGLLHLILVENQSRLLACSSTSNNFWIVEQHYLFPGDIQDLKCIFLKIFIHV